MGVFQLNRPYPLSGDQSNAVVKLVDWLERGCRDQLFFGATGTGKTYTMANVISELDVPAIIISHNKILAAQLYAEMCTFFPNNAVEYFVSYYDYYQPEAYIPQTDTYIEKDSAINDKIDLLRHSATSALLARRDVIVVASVSCIYGLGSPEWYVKMLLKLSVGDFLPIDNLRARLVEMEYSFERECLKRGFFRIRGDTLEIFPSNYENVIVRILLFGNKIEKIIELGYPSGEFMRDLDDITVFPNSHYVVPRPTVLQAVEKIRLELQDRLSYYSSAGMLLECKRLEQRVSFDIEMIIETGTCKGIENYSRYLSGRKAGDPPPTLLEYMPEDSVMLVDESHVTVPQISAMYNGDRSRKSTLVDCGFRLPSALDNRPLNFQEWESIKGRTVYVSATPGRYEIEKCQDRVVEQIIRPTGLLDPKCYVKPASYQVDDAISECKNTVSRGYRALVSVLTKKMAEDLSSHFSELGIKSAFMHYGVSTIDRIELIKELRSGGIDVLVGVNLLREGLDLPECALMTILDADKEGFLRSYTALIQMIGRVARCAEGRVILYADRLTGAMDHAIAETNRRREVQEAYNLKHGIVPKGIIKPIDTVLLDKINEKKHLSSDNKSKNADYGQYDNLGYDELKEMMALCAERLDFETAAILRDKMLKLGECNKAREK